MSPEDKAKVRLANAVLKDITWSSSIQKFIHELAISTMKSYINDGEYDKSRYAACVTEAMRHIQEDIV